MNDLTEICAAEFETHVAELFEREEKLALLDKYKLGRAPVIGFPFHARDSERQYIKRLRHLACAALAAQEWHKKHASAWAWAHPLPVHHDELGPELNTPSARQLLLQSFGRSLQHHKWNLRHPPFPDWACSVMASEFTSEIILRSNLDAEFPPQPLVELSDCLNWWSPEEAARDAAFWEFRKQLDNGASVAEARKISGFYP
jgi:hypothetical protein